MTLERKTVMKRFLRIISTLLIVSMLISAFCACTEMQEQAPESDPLEGMTDKEKAQYLSLKSDEYYADRMKTSSLAEINISGNIGGVTMESTSKIKQNAAYDKVDPENVNYLISSEVISESKIGDTTKKERYTLTEAYSDDYYIYSYESNNAARNVYQYSTCFLNTFEKYLEYKDGFGLEVDENADFETVSVTKDEKLGIYLLKYSDPKIDLMRRVTRYIALMEDGLVYNADFKSMSLEITVSTETMAITSRTYNLKAKTLKTTSYDIEYDFKVEETFAKNASFSAMPENLEQDYVKNDNLILRQMTLLELKKIAASEDVSFDMVSGTSRRMPESLFVGMDDSYNTMRFDYGKRNGKFMYRLSDSSTTEILYNGDRTFVLDGENISSSTYTTEFDARSLIYSLSVQPFVFEEYMISSVNVEYDGQYAVRMPLKIEYASEFLAKLALSEVVPVQFVAYLKNTDSGYELVSLRLEAVLGQVNYYEYAYQFVEIRNISTADLEKAETVEQ